MTHMEPLFMRCHPERIACEIYPHLLKSYHVSIRTDMAQPLRLHVKRTFERHWILYEHSLHAVLWGPNVCHPIVRPHELWEEYLLTRANLWKNRLTIARLIGYDHEEEFIRFVNRDFRQTLWQACWRTRPRITTEK